MKLFSLVLRLLVLVACALIVSGQSSVAYDDDEGELEDEITTQDSTDGDHSNGTVELY